MNGYTFGHDVHNLRYTDHQPLSLPNPGILFDPMALAGKAVKLELYANAIRSGRGALGTMGVGFFGSSPMHPYSGRSKYAYQARSLWRPGSSSLNPFGILPTAIDALNIPRNLEGIHATYKNTGAFFGRFVSDPFEPMFNLDGVFSADKSHTKAKSPWNKYRGNETKPWHHRFYSSSEAKSNALNRTNYVGFLDKRLVMHNEYRNMMRSILPKDVYQKISKRQMTQDFVNTIRDVYDQPRSLTYMNPKRFNRIWNERHRSVFSIMTGAEEVGPWNRRVREAIETTALFTDESAKRTTLQNMFTTGRAEGKWWAVPLGKGKKYRDTSAAMQAALSNYTEYMGGNRYISDEAVSTMDDYAVRYSKRLSNARLLKATMIGTIGIDILAHAGRKTYELFRDIPAQVASTIGRGMHQEFGSGDVLWTSRMATERQRAVHAIQDAQMNARYLLGQEASLYH